MRGSSLSYINGELPIETVTASAPYPGTRGGNHRAFGRVTRMRGISMASKKNRSRKSLAVALAIVGVAGLSMASAAQLNVTSDTVAAGTSVVACLLYTSP